MEFIIKLLTVLSLGAVELWIAIPIGLGLELNPLITGFTAAMGAIMSTAVIVFIGEGIRTRLVRLRYRRKGKERQGRIIGIWERYGVVGLGLLAPLITGAPLGVALGLTLGVRTDRLFFWAIIGIVLWSAIITLAGILGLTWLKGLGYWTSNQ